MQWSCMAAVGINGHVLVNLTALLCEPQSAPDKSRRDLEVGLGVLLQVQAGALQPAFELRPCTTQPTDLCP